MSQIPTAEEYSKKIMEDVFNNALSDNPLKKDFIAQGLIDFAKLHVEAALESASEKAIAKENPDDYGTGEIWVDKNSILKAYPLTNIK